MRSIKRFFGYTFKYFWPTMAMVAYLVLMYYLSKWDFWNKMTVAIGNGQTWLTRVTFFKSVSSFWPKTFYHWYFTRFDNLEGATRSLLFLPAILFFLIAVVVIFVFQGIVIILSGILALVTIILTMIFVYAVTIGLVALVPIAGYVLAIIYIVRENKYYGYQLPVVEPILFVLMNIIIPLVLIVTYAIGVYPFFAFVFH